MLNIFNTHLSGSGIDFSSGDSASFDAITNLSPQVQESLRSQAKDGISLDYFAISAFMWLGAVAVLGLGNVYIGKRGDGNGDRVVRVSYLGSWVRGRGGGAEVKV
jgi:hypothetical protein